MEKIIEIRTEGLNVSRELICDLCNSDLYIGSHKAEKIYSIFWVERNGDIYLEKYICESCYKKYFSRNKAIPFDEAPRIFQKVLKRDFQRSWYGIITPCSSEEEFRLLQENPFLIELWGEKF